MPKMHGAEEAPQVLLFDEPALAVAQQWMHKVLSQAAKEPPSEVFKFFRRETTVSQGFLGWLLLDSSFICLKSDSPTSSF
jgi:hypothetical protein